MGKDLHADGRAGIDAGRRSGLSPPGSRSGGELPERAGVVAIPTSAFYQSEHAPSWLVRFSLCRRPESVRTAVEQLVEASGRVG